MGLASALAAQAGVGSAQQHTTSMQSWNPPPATMPTPVPAPGYMGPPAAAAPVSPSVIATRLQQIVSTNSLSTFYSQEKLHSLAAQVAQRVDFNQLAARWRMSLESAISLAALALYDVVIYADDSGSMASENGERIDDLKLIVAKVAEVATLFDDDGIAVRFINADLQGNHIKTSDDVNNLIVAVSYNWDTKLGTQLETKILQPMAYNRRLAKPLLVITVTDGEPTDSPKDMVVSVIKHCAKKMDKAGYGPHAVAFQFAQVGRDHSAQEFLATLDNHPKVGDMIDCTSYFELEQAEYASKGITLSVEAWLVKLMVGAIDLCMDQQDEAHQAGSHQVTKKHKKKGLLDKLFG